MSILYKFLKENIYSRRTRVGTLGLIDDTQTRITLIHHQIIIIIIVQRSVIRLIKVRLDFYHEFNERLKIIVQR